MKGFASEFCYHFRLPPLSSFAIIPPMNKTQRTTLAALFASPIRAGIKWADIEALVRGLGGEVHQRAGSRVMFVLNGVRATFHAPHPSPDTDKGAVKSVRQFLSNAGVKP